jgi:hypothetical protein
MYWLQGANVYDYCMLRHWIVGYPDPEVRARHRSRNLARHGHVSLRKIVPSAIAAADDVMWTVADDPI